MGKFRRILGLVMVTIVTLYGTVVLPAKADHDWQGTMTKFRYVAPNNNNSRDYWVYTPLNLPAGPVPMYVNLHGCDQTALELAIDTKLNHLADQRKFVAVYPEQQIDQTPLQQSGNGIRCWNWFYPNRFTRNPAQIGEPSTIAGITSLVADQAGLHLTQPGLVPTALGLNIDPRRIFISGLSAGADMSVIVGALFPDVYAAIGAFAGCAYYVCTDETGELAHMAMGDNARPMPVFVGQGSADDLNNVALGEGLVQQWLGTDDLADDGSANLSISRVPVVEVADATGGGSGNGYPYTIDHYSDSRGCSLIDFYLIQGLGHKYPYAGEHGSDGNPVRPYTDPNGPDLTTASYEFFMDHPMPAPGDTDSCLPPIANDDTALTAEDTPVVIDVLANDSDPDGDPLTVLETTDPINGEVTNNGIDVTYTPDEGFFGTDIFDYTVSDGDGNGGTDTATVTVTVAEAPNQAPDAADDVSATDEDIPVIVDVLANDSDPDGDSLSVGSVTQGSNGSVTNNVGDVTYYPNPNWSGVDSFTYQACDPAPACDSAVVTVTVAPVNDPPVTEDDLANTNEDTPIIVDVLANDSDPDGDSLTVGSVTQGSNGTVTNNGSDVTYEPDAGFTGTDSFSYEACDAELCTSALVTVTVNPVEGNDPPDAVDDASSTDEDIPVIVDVLANDSDPDGDSLTVGSVTQGSNGTVTNNGGDVTYYPDPNWNGTDSFAYQACDPAPACSTATVSVTVNPVNDDPQAIDDAGSTAEDTPVVIAVLTNDSDPEGDSLSLSGFTQGTNGSVSDNGNGTITYDPSPNFNGTDSFSYTVTDGNGGSDTANVSVTVNPVNDAPEPQDDVSVSDEDIPVAIDVLANDSDVDGDPLTVGAVTQPANGFVTNNGTDVTYIPDENFNGSDSFTYESCDVFASCVTAKVSVTVNPVNDDPVALDDSAATEPGTPVTIDVLANDSDVDGDTLTIDSVGDPATGTVTNNGDGTVTYTPAPGFTGPDSFDYTVSDGQGGFDTATVTVEVRAPAPGKKFIFAKALDDHSCSLTEWHFVINQIRPGSSAAPPTIRVTWENGATADVALSKFSGKVAHYSTSLNLDSRVVSASAQMYEDWEGQFNLSHGPCN